MEQGQEKIYKVVFSDGGIDRAITGVLIDDTDEHFISIKSNGRIYKFNKNRIVVMEILRGD